MDIKQFQPIIEQLLNQLLAQSPNFIEHLKNVLIMIINGVNLVGSINVLIAQYPEITILANQLLSLISAGGSIHEIAIALVNLAQSMGLSLQVVVQLLQIIGGMLALF